MKSLRRIALFLVGLPFVILLAIPLSIFAWVRAIFWFGSPLRMTIEEIVIEDDVEDDDEAMEPPTNGHPRELSDPDRRRWI